MYKHSHIRIRIRKNWKANIRIRIRIRKNQKADIRIRIRIRKNWKKHIRYIPTDVISILQWKRKK